MTTTINLSPFNFFPTDVLPFIFKNLSLELDKIALVCKVWQEATDYPSLRNEIRPPRAMGVKELKKINPAIVNAGIELPLPRCAYRDFAKKGGLLFFSPGKVKVKNDKEEIKEIALNNLKDIRNLFKNPIPDLKTDFAKDEREVEAPHWALIDTEILGFGKTYKQQLEIAKEEDEKTYPERYKETSENSDRGVESQNKPRIEPKQIVNLLNFNDLVLCLYMEIAILKERHFYVAKDPSNALIRVNKGPCGEKPVIISFEDLLGPSLMGPPSFISQYKAIQNVGFLCARKFFGS
jgi:hypothetical protein